MAYNADIIWYIMLGYLLFHLYASLSNKSIGRVCYQDLDLWWAPLAFSNYYLLIYNRLHRTWRAVPNLLTRSLLAISAALTPSAAFVPARITAERGKKAKTSAREFSLSNKRNVIWMMQALCTGPRGLHWLGYRSIWLGPEMGYRAKFSAQSCSQGLINALNTLKFCSSSPSLPLKKFYVQVQSQMERPRGSSENQYILGIWITKMLHLESGFRIFTAPHVLGGHY